MMKTKHNIWLSTESMHSDSLNWLSELKFIKDEQLFFNDLVKSYTLQLIDSKHYTESKKIIDLLNVLENEKNTLIDKVTKHEKKLKVMVDGINQIEEENIYKAEHTKLIRVMNQYLENYKMLKTQLFSLVKNIIKEEKQKHLLN